ncbi:MAG: hypothetical protein LC642_03965 [Verrucomicrobiaceae bacterium]|nr:hypothetical protein [Verrucomicrobiaceae bacterium]
MHKALFTLVILTAPFLVLLEAAGGSKLPEPTAKKSSAWFLKFNAPTTRAIVPRFNGVTGIWSRM